MADGWIDRRRLLIGGGTGVGLIVAWGLWPRDYTPSVTLNPGESGYGAWLKIGDDGHVTVAVPQTEHGQGIWTVLAQIVADELGADWRTVGVEPAPLSPLYANTLGLDDLFEGGFDRMPDTVRATRATRAATMLTAASSAVRMFEHACRQAGAGARVLLCKAAASRWDVDWTACTVAAGFVTQGNRRIRFGEIAGEAAGGTLPDPLPFGVQGAGALAGRSVPRLDTPSKVDGSANFTADIRLADMVHVAVRGGPVGDSRLVRVDRAAADRVPGMVTVVETDRWVAAAGVTSWAAQRGLDALAPRFSTRGAVVDDASIARALDAALDGPGIRVAQAGDLATVFRQANLVIAEYTVGLGVHASIETPAAVAQYREGRLELWLQTLAPVQARAAAARAVGLAEIQVVVHAMQIGGSFGAGLESEAAEQAAILAVRLKRPVSVVWSRGEALLHDRFRPPAKARMAARLAPGGAILGWSAKIAAPATGHALARRLMPGAYTDLALGGRTGDPYAVAGALPPYALPTFAIDHHPAEIGLVTGHMRGGMHGLTAFFTECFLDELAHVAGVEPMSYRIGMLGGDPRLARCLSTAAALGGWDGGVAGGGQGIAAHRFRGSSIAVLAEAHIDEGQAPRVDRLVAAVDCGRAINPDIVRQQIEGGLIFGMAQALGASTGVTRNLADARGFDTLHLPRLADAPDITVELIQSGEAPGGVAEIGVPAVAPAIANALRAATGYRIRTLPLRAGAR